MCIIIIIILVQLNSWKLRWYTFIRYQIESPNSFFDFLFVHYLQKFWQHSGLHECRISITFLIIANSRIQYFLTNLNLKIYSLEHEKDQWRNSGTFNNKTTRNWVNLEYTLAIFIIQDSWKSSDSLAPFSKTPQLVKKNYSIRRRYLRLLDFHVVLLFGK